MNCISIALYTKTSEATWSKAFLSESMRKDCTKIKHHKPVEKDESSTLFKKKSKSSWHWCQDVKSVSISFYIQKTASLSNPCLVNKNLIALTWIYWIFLLALGLGKGNDCIQQFKGLRCCRKQRRATGCSTHSRKEIYNLTSNVRRILTKLPFKIEHILSSLLL